MHQGLQGSSATGLTSLGAVTWAALVLGLLAWVPGCTWESRVPRGQPITMPENAAREIRRLALCEPVTALLDCAGERECNHWYRVDIRDPGKLRVELTLLEMEAGQPAGEPSALTRMVLRPMGKPILGQQVGTQGEPLEISAWVQPDVYGVLVQGGGVRRQYRLVASLGEDDFACPDPSGGIAVPDAS